MPAASPTSMDRPPLFSERVAMDWAVFWMPEVEAPTSATLVLTVASK